MDKNYLQYFHFSYTQEHLKQLEAIENELKFSHFDSQECPKFRAFCVRCIKTISKRYYCSDY